MIEGNAGTTLLDAVRAWPTPVVSDGKGPQTRAPGAERSPCDDSLSTRVDRVWPTPRATEGEKGGPSSRDGSGSAHLCATAVAWADYPTPSAVEYGSSQNGINGKGGENERPSAGTPSLSTACRTGALPGGKGVLNPYFVEALMGWSQGWTNPDEPVGDHAPFPPPPSDAEGWMAYLDRWPSAVPAVQREDPRTRLRIDRLRACGNGVVPQQAEEAYCELFEALGVALSRQLPLTGGLLASLRAAGVDRLAGDALLRESLESAIKNGATSYGSRSLEHAMHYVNPLSAPASKGWRSRWRSG